MFKKGPESLIFMRLLRALARLSVSCFFFGRAMSGCDSSEPVSLIKVRLIYDSHSTFSLCRSILFLWLSFQIYMHMYAHTHTHTHTASLSSLCLINAAKLLVVSTSWSAKWGVFCFGASVEYSNCLSFKTGRNLHCINTAASMLMWRFLLSSSHHPCNAQLCWTFEQSRLDLDLTDCWTDSCYFYEPLFGGQFWTIVLCLLLSFLWYFTVSSILKIHTRAEPQSSCADVSANGL